MVVNGVVESSGFFIVFNELYVVVGLVGVNVVVVKMMFDV